MLDYLTAIGSIATPILVLGLSAIGWRIRTQLERRVILKDRLHDARIATYNEILKPFIVLLTSQAAWQADPNNKDRDKDQIALRQLLSLEYRELGFRLSLVADDAVVRAYNDLMQWSFRLSRSVEPPQPVEVMSLLGLLLLAIRKSMGNESTSLDRWQMLEWFVVDASEYRKQRTA